MNVYISGGAKNGKSTFAQRKAKELSEAGGTPLYYVATMIARDSEDDQRVARHRIERAGWGFETIEQPVDLTAILEDPSIDKNGVFMLDSVTAIMENEMFRVENGEFVCDGTAPGRVRNDMVAFAKATGNTVFVSDGIYGDMGEYSQSTEDYRKALADCDRALAEACDKVVEITYGIEEVWK